MLTDLIVFENFEFLIDENQFYKITVNDRNEFDIPDLQLLVAAQKEIGGHYLPVLVICHDHATTNIELLKEISQNKNNPYSKADAFVLRSMAQRILANFYLKILNPERPTKFFNNKDEAITWLSQFK